MKIIFKYILIIIFIFLSIIITYLSTKGYETDRFNNIVEEAVKKKEPDINLKLKKIKLKIEIKKLDLFFSTREVELKYKDFSVPLKDIKIYLHAPSLMQAKIYVKKLNISADNLQLKTIQDFATRIKPSNFKSFILNNIKSGNISSEFNFSFTKNLEVKDYKVKGRAQNIDIDIDKNYKLKNSSFNFVADKNLILINSITANIKGLPITNGSIKLENQDNLIIDGSINSSIDLNNKKLKNLIPNLNKIKVLENKIEGKGDFVVKFNFNFSKTLKLIDYGINIDSNFKKLEIILKNKIDSIFFNEKFSKLNLDKTNIKFDFKKNTKKTIRISGKYSLDNSEVFEKYKIKTIIDKTKTLHEVELNFSEYIKLDLINYEKNKNKSSIINFTVQEKQKELIIKNLEYLDGNSLINLKEIKIIQNKFIENFNTIKVKTFKKNDENNNFEIVLDKKILVSGSKFDSTNLIKEIKNNKKKNVLFSKINKDIDINFKKVVNNFNAEIKNFHLLGKIEKGKFIKISSKSDFSQNKHLDITLKKVKDSNFKNLEIYSDLPKPLLSEFSFFKGLNGGNLLFTSTYDNEFSNSNLKIYNFKVVDAPAFAKLLALADLRGAADLLSGDGISFDILEIKFKKDKEILDVIELYAVGSSISILMDGYINKAGLVSLRGTMVPAKELNKLISKIPILGNILIGKEIGEGVFGVSFKMKGMPNNIKTTVNPIKTLTPRFITKALQKQKKN